MANHLVLPARFDGLVTIEENSNHYCLWFEIAEHKSLCVYDQYILKTIAVFRSTSAVMKCFNVRKSDFYNLQKLLLNVDTDPAGAAFDAWLHYSSERRPPKFAAGPFKWASPRRRQGEYLFIVGLGTEGLEQPRPIRSNGCRPEGACPMSGKGATRG